MRVLVGWDDPGEAETIDLCLNVDSTEATVATSREAFEQALAESRPDVILLATTFPSKQEAFALFQKIRTTHPETPVVGAWEQGQISEAIRFISNGLHSYVIRDAGGEFIFLLPSVLEAADASVRAKRASELAEKLREEVDSVRRIQESVIPHDFRVPPGYAVAARYEPSQIRILEDRPVVMAGGDYYDVFGFDHEKLVLVLGDAAGHGVKACMSIMTMHTLIKMIHGQAYPNTAEFVTEVNRRLCHNDVVGGDQGGFITLLYCTLDARTHRMQWTSAGHPMPLLQNLETNEVVRLGSEEQCGLPLAIDEDWRYELCEAVIPKNSRVLLYTDGLDEAFPEGGEEHEQFGEQGIIHTLQASRDLPVDQALDQLFVQSAAATKGAGRHDDTSVVLVERLSDEKRRAQQAEQADQKGEETG